MMIWLIDPYHHTVDTKYIEAIQIFRVSIKPRGTVFALSSIIPGYVLSIMQIESPFSP